MKTGEPQRPLLGEPAAHELAQRLEVALVAEVLLRVGASSGFCAVLAVVLLARARSTRLKPVPTGSTKTRSVNASHDSSFSTSARRHRRQRAVRRERDPLRPDGAHVQVRGRGAGPAVEDEGHRPVGVAAVRDVRDREDLRRGLLLLPQHDPLRGRGVRIAFFPRPQLAVVSAPAGGLVLRLFGFVLRVCRSSAGRYRLRPCARNDRWRSAYSRSRTSGARREATPHRRLRELIEEIELADEVGLDVFGVGEHHRPEFAVSTPAVVLAAGGRAGRRASG